ncbi:hypothetical protein ACTM43_22020 [Citrobacter freundii]|uniref:Lysine-specific histone demethylase n=1 Tax=Klebsiella pneumoniae TaxID=573 RepID=A0A223DQH2_KLEPN|nr:MULTISPECIES: hypothetical protein [Enterobacteriaceae]ASS84955.1 Lysine-specific histone demethylase [Klebsiella pneumoniae]MBJ9068039.1 hypothetical protein [Citrobacter freundii]MCR3683396.1 hypothetical protein [Citrobacter freundii]HED2435653.1 hypothetical protein [Citrobacter freundii]
MASKGIEKLIADAERAGCMVRRNNGRTEISKKGKKQISLVICPDGTAYRGDVDLTVTLTIRTQKEMRDVLNLPVRKSVPLRKFTVVINGAGGYSSHQIREASWKEALNAVKAKYKADNPDEPEHEIGVASVISGWPDVWC